MNMNRSGLVTLAGEHVHVGKSLQELRRFAFYRWHKNLHLLADGILQGGLFHGKLIVSTDECARGEEPVCSSHTA